MVFTFKLASATIRTLWVATSVKILARFGFKDSSGMSDGLCLKPLVILVPNGPAL